MLADDSQFDLIVIGGGINGAAIAREASLSGVSVLLLERDDFCAGTSAASTRLIHGGLRYLEHAEFSLVRESLAERERLLTTAPHLVRPLEIFLPLTRASRRGRLTIGLGMWLYDLLSIGKSLPRHRMLSRAALLDAMPGLNQQALLGGAAYYDAQVRFPERLVLEIALDAAAHGATLATHTVASELLVDAGQIQGVAFEVAGRKGVARAPVVVNAAGPWVDAVLGPLQTTRLIGGTRGSHLVALPFSDAPAHAVYAEAASDGRPFFVIPWNGLYLIGTTDERYDGAPEAASISGDEFEYLIAETRRLFPGARDLRQRICYTYAGVRPLPSTAGVRTGAITRRHLIKAHPSIRGLYSIIGGKLTTHRSLAVDCLRHLRSVLPTPAASPTAERPLPGALLPDERDAMLDEIGRSVGGATALRWWHTYGGKSRQLFGLAAASPELLRRIGPESDVVVGELVYALEHEQARTLADLIQRRTMAGLQADFGQLSAPLAADSLVRLGIWDQHRAAEEVSAFLAWSRRFAVPHS
jgi:glycerol-3-phosphate dehydrogenase